jgi:hypothetical protein
MDRVAKIATTAGGFHNVVDATWLVIDISERLKPSGLAQGLSASFVQKVTPR